MALYFTQGQVYTNTNADRYGTDKGSVVTNRQAAGSRTYNWLCLKVSNTFAVFKTRSGRSDGTVERLRIYRDQLGQFVFPKGRYDGAPVFRS
jgi:hypothetical protein